MVISRFLYQPLLWNIYCREGILPGITIVCPTLLWIADLHTYPYCTSIIVLSLQMLTMRLFFRTLLFCLVVFLRPLNHLLQATFTSNNPEQPDILMIIQDMCNASRKHWPVLNYSSQTIPNNIFCLVVRTRTAVNQWRYQTKTQSWEHQDLYRRKKQ